MAPSNKVTAATIAAAVGTIVFWALKEYAQVNAPEPVQMAVVMLLTALLTGVVGYLVPEHNPAPSAIATLRRRQAVPTGGRRGAGPEP